MARKSAVPQLSESRKTVLRSITKRRDSPRHLVRRAGTALLAGEGQTDKELVPQARLCHEECSNLEKSLEPTTGKNQCRGSRRK